tara:strand:- start:63 stop:1085 length:1023 start_codon:yes stop_codon:yes gene_type:complete
MSIQKVAEYFFPAGNFAQIRANAPDRATYNIESTRDLVKNQPVAITPFAPVGAAVASIPYDLIQASMRARDTFFKDNPTSFGITDDAEVPIGPSAIDFASAVAAENPIDSLIERTKGATLGLADRIARSPEFLSNLFFTSAGAGSDRVNLPNIDITNQLDDYYEKGEMMDNVADAPEAGITRKLLDAIKGAGSAISNLGIVGALKNLDQFKNLSPLDQKFILQQAGGNRPAKDKYGYNIRSAFGNYASLVGSKVDKARDKIARGIPLTAMDQYYLDKEKERRALEEKAQREFLANQARTQSRGGDGPQNNPQGGLGRQDYSRAASADFASLADELGIDYR